MMTQNMRAILLNIIRVKKGTPTSNLKVADVCFTAIGEGDKMELNIVDKIFIALIILVIIVGPFTAGYLTGIKIERSRIGDWSITVEEGGEWEAPSKDDLYDYSIKTPSIIFISESEDDVTFEDCKFLNETRIEVN